MTYFLDTSALVKIYHKEEGSENVLEVYKRENMNISELSIFELLSTVYRKYREKEIIRHAPEPDDECEAVAAYGPDDQRGERR